MPTDPIRRMTLFKVPDWSNRNRLLEIYKTMRTDAKRRGVPYIVSCHAGETFEDHRRQGYTVSVFTTFKSLDDMRYYDEDCEAHRRLKNFAKGVHEGVLMVYFQSIIEDDPPPPPPPCEGGDKCTAKKA